MRGVKLGPRPLNRLRGNRVHAAGTTDNGSVMVALYGHRAVFDFAHQSIDHKARVGAVPDVVAKENEAANAAPRA